MSTSHTLKPCSWACPWKGTAMCAQCLLNSQSLADGRVSLGVLCGLKSLYQANDLPPCIVGHRLDWSGPRDNAIGLTAVMA
ncbi:hypothetical protein [Prosthecobacter sp.]|uniref:hypothetical protein n=1 Tax=Prosthecobacter sp. TaxID=1965333 RepID=UPI0037838562